MFTYRIPPFLSNDGTIDAGWSAINWTNRFRTSARLSSYNSKFPCISVPNSDITYLTFNK